MQWFLDPQKSQSEKVSSRPGLYALHLLYLERKYDEVLAGALAIWRSVEPGARDGTAEEVELVDLILRSSLRVSAGGEADAVSDEVLAVARRWQVIVSPASLRCRSRRN